MPQSSALISGVQSLVLYETRAVSVTINAGDDEMRPNLLVVLYYYMQNESLRQPFSCQ